MKMWHKPRIYKDPESVNIWICLFQGKKWNTSNWNTAMNVMYQLYSQMYDPYGHIFNAYYHERYHHFENHPIN